MHELSTESHLRAEICQRFIYSNGVHLLCHHIQNEQNEQRRTHHHTDSSVDEYDFLSLSFTVSLSFIIYTAASITTT